MRQKLIWFAVVLGAMYFIVEFFVGEKTAAGEALKLTEVYATASHAMAILLTMALGLGVINLFHAHGANIIKRRKDWIFSVVVFVTFFTVIGFMVWEYRLEQQEITLRERSVLAVDKYTTAAAIDDPVERDEAFRQLTDEELALATDYYASQQAYQFRPRTFYLEAFINPLAQTVMALLGFYITYAAYRAFRVRSLEATVMMLSATIMILGSDPIGGWISVELNWLLGLEDAPVWMPIWADFDNRVMMSGMQRGLLIGISVAMIAASLRMLLGLEKGIIEVSSGGD